ncbi:M20 family metallopeptidase [Aeromonas veronii]|uniref:M20 metallopeptidase family protein n=1 Tax=Aeromonas veronii TaxID=654 RepID=UPI001117ADCB|nr:M20 family metallopeptidase [Aeromonas veronii]TNI02202.1 amidohydrolase [Aeromonas veronii]HDO1313987.1 amidohydrolase [Aeromonas veronii]
MNILDEALALKDEIVSIRRQLHTYPELGFELPNTTKLVFDKLLEYGCNPERVGRSGVICDLGREGKTFLLRADMDALPMHENSGLDFSSKNNNAHTCGHDAHTAMLLGAVKILKNNESQLNGCVRVIFQPAEEILAGADDMISNGILEAPKVSAAMALHIVTGIDYAHTGNIYSKAGAITYSGDAIEISIVGKDAHGSTPNLGVDAIFIASQVIIALQNVIAREIPPEENAVLLVGKINGGTSGNTVAGSATLNISARVKSDLIRDFIKQRIFEISTSIAEAFRGTSHVKFISGVPPLFNDPHLTESLESYCKEIIGCERVKKMDSFHGSEDFALIAKNVPSVLFTLGVGGRDEGYEYALHHPSMRVNEDALPIGAAVYAGCALSWLRNN